jgi:hypothetical protein
MRDETMNPETQIFMHLLQLPQTIMMLKEEIRSVPSYFHKSRHRIPQLMFTHVKNVKIQDSRASLPNGAYIRCLSSTFCS